MPKTKVTHKKAQQNPFKNYKTPLIILIIVVVVVALGTIFRGWLRVTVIPKTVEAFYLSGVNNTYDKESLALENPFTALGYSNPTKSDKCSLEAAQSFHTAVDCTDSQQAYTKLPTDAASQTKVQQQAASLQSMLGTNGWQGGSNGVTLTSLVDGTAKGIDSSPDAFYQTTDGNNVCIFDTTIAYSHPQPPAIRSLFTCDRVVNFLGTPKVK